MSQNGHAPQGHIAHMGDENGSSMRHSTGQPNRSRPALAPKLGRTPVPTPTIFEWKTNVHRKMAALQGQLDTGRVGDISGRRSSVSYRRASSGHEGIGVTTTAQDGEENEQDANAFRLTEEFEDEETRFQRSTTKIAIDVSRAEAERAIAASNTVQKQSAKLLERIDALEAKYERDMKEGAKVQADLASKVNGLMAEKQILKSAVTELQDENKAKDKRFSDLEDVIFFLQDEINKLQEAANKPKTAVAKPGAASAPGAAGPAKKAAPAPAVVKKKK